MQEEKALIESDESLQLLDLPTPLTGLDQPSQSRIREHGPRNTRLSCPSRGEATSGRDLLARIRAVLPNLRPLESDQAQPPVRPMQLCEQVA